MGTSGLQKWLNAMEGMVEDSFFFFFFLNYSASGQAAPYRTLLHTGYTVGNRGVWVERLWSILTRPGILRTRPKASDTEAEL